ncbi:MAG: hypothetical protein HC767_09965 [Akkermansiaceae bacterium]|nr:hypothetical protein [Akkermansiaceae bacterium]
MAYERALLISPRDENLLGNLARARKAAVVSEDQARYPWLDEAAHFFSRNELSWLVVTSALWIGGLALLAGAVKFPKGWQRTASCVSISIAGAIILIGSVILYLRRAESNRGVVLSEKSVVRLSPLEKQNLLATSGKAAQCS